LEANVARRIAFPNGTIPKSRFGGMDVDSTVETGWDNALGYHDWLPYVIFCLQSVSSRSYAMGANDCTFQVKHSIPFS
jgi:hypothetical protein